MASAAQKAPRELTAMFERMGVPCAVLETAAEGKHVKALADVEQGAGIFEERPLVSWRLHNNETNQINPHTACDYCHAAVEKEQPVVACSSCQDAVYCNGECQSAALPTHQFLCKRLGVLRGFHAAEALKTGGEPSPISAESVARCVATMAAKFMQVSRQNPGVPDAELFPYATLSFNRLLEPPRDATFDDVDVTAWAAIVRRVMIDSLSAAVGKSVAEGLLSDDTLRTILGQLTINAQGLFIKPRVDGGHSVEAAGVFTLQSCFNHSCSPNARVVNTTDRDITLEATKRIGEGEEITISYLPALVLELEPYDKRRERLRPYFFTCACPRCASESEAASLKAADGEEASAAAPQAAASS